VRSGSSSSTTWISGGVVIGSPRYRRQRCRCRRDGQLEVEPRPSPAALDPDSATMGLDERARDRQAQSHTLTLGGVERVEEPRQVAAAMPWPRSSTAISTTSPLVRTTMTIVRRSSGRPATAYHGVEQQVEQHLLPPGSCRPARARRAPRAGPRASPGGGAFGAHHGFDLAHRLMDLEWLTLDVVAGEQRPELADHLAGAQVVAANVGEDLGQLGSSVAPEARMRSAASVLARMAPSG